MRGIGAVKLQKEELTEVLLAVLKALRVAESKFRAAASVVADAKLRQTLLERARAWAQAARELTALARVERTTVCVAHASVRAARAWLPGDVAPLIECERCEENVALRYRDALDHRLPTDVERVLMRQFDEVLSHLGTLQRLLAERGRMPLGAAAH
jgi:hypothetical protein